MTELRARPTIYQGISMRSRLEARVAAQLDEMGMRWDYEPRAYALGRDQYLPDFEILHPVTGERIGDYLEVRPTLAGAERAMDQMPLIWASEPGACLHILVPDEPVHFFAFGFSDDRRWRRADGAW